MDSPLWPWWGEPDWFKSTSTNRSFHPYRYVGHMEILYILFCSISIPLAPSLVYTAPTIHTMNFKNLPKDFGLHDLLCIYATKPQEPTSSGPSGYMWHISSSSTCACCLLSAICATTIPLSLGQVYVTCKFQQYLCLLSPACHLCNHNPLSLGQQCKCNTYVPAAPVLVVSSVPFVQPQSLCLLAKYMW
jgi:hypothetical protein